MSNQMLDPVADPFETPQRAWWLREAMADDPGEPCPPLKGAVEADVVIIGGGYTGMWTAHFLKLRKPETEVVLLESDICGGGPSGRNGGFMNSLWEDIEALIDLFGDEQAVRIGALAERSIPEMSAFCEKHGIDAWFDHVGHLGVSTAPQQDGAWNGVVETAARLGLPDDLFREISPEKVQKVARSEKFRGGLMQSHVAMVQPARLARGIRKVILEQGVKIYENTSAYRLKAGPPAVVGTAEGTVTAKEAVIAVNAAAAGWKQFRRKILPRATYIVMTAPAPERLEEIGWTGGQGIYDHRATLHYLRTTRDGRIAFGAASSRAGIGTGMGARLSHDPASYRKLVQDLHRWFPEFRDVPIEAAWGGPVDVSGYHLPFFGTGSPGNVHYGLGFTGGGVGPCHLGGRILSGLALGVADEYTTLPLVGYRPKSFPPNPFLSIGAFITQESIMRTDDAHEQGRRANPLLHTIAKLPRKLGYHVGL